MHVQARHYLCPATVTAAQPQRIHASQRSCKLLTPSLSSAQAHTVTQGYGLAPRKVHHATRNAQKIRVQVAVTAFAAAHTVLHLYANHSPTLQATDDDGDLPIERQLKGRGRGKSKKAQTQVANKSPASAVQQAADMPPSDQFESSTLLVLLGLFVAIIGQGLFLALSGFLSESLDQFAQDVVYKTFSPTVGVFVACSAGYGLWKSKQNNK